MRPLTAAQRELVESSLSIAEIEVAMALRHIYRWVPKEELLSSAYFGLCHAAARYVEGPWRPYAVTCCRNRIRRDQQRFMALGGVSLDHCEPIRTPDYARDDASIERHNECWDALEGELPLLPAREREVMEHRLSGLTLAQAAASMGLGPDRARTLSMHAMRALRERLAR
jgi:DNA-directed RNA polymerase specialized sigma24 family protein